MVMRTVWIAALIFAALMLSSAQAAEADAADENQAPDFVLKSVAGPNLRLSEYRGEVVLITFWATWCGECRGQLKALDDMFATYNDSGLEILSINLDSKIAQARDTAQALDLSFPVLLDAPGDVAELFDVRDLPFAVFVDREGRIRETVDGFSRSDEAIFLERVRNLLRE
jgi:peroxiredoxin